MNWIEAFARMVARLMGNQSQIQVAVPLATGYSQFNMKKNGFKPTWIVIHHSYSDDNQTRNWDSIRTYHMSYRHNGEIITEEEYAKLLTEDAKGLEKPWDNIGYHFGIENVYGKLTVLPGRQIGEVGAHAKGFNDKSIGICLVGNYDIEPPSKDRVDVLSGLCRNLQIEFKIPRDHVISHHETFTYQGIKPPKTCPGLSFDMDNFRKSLRT